MKIKLWHLGIALMLSVPALASCGQPCDDAAPSSSAVLADDCGEDDD